MCKMCKNVALQIQKKNLKNYITTTMVTANCFNINTNLYIFNIFNFTFQRIPHYNLIYIIILSKKKYASYFTIINKVI